MQKNLVQYATANKQTLEHNITANIADTNSSQSRKSHKIIKI